MHKVTLVFLTLLTTFSCTKSAETADGSDSLSVSQDTVVLADESSEIKPVDTIFTEVTMEKSFDKPQLNKKIAYVYRDVGLDVYEEASDVTDNSSPVIGHIDFKGKVELVDDLNNNFPTDEIKMEGLFGRFVAVRLGDKTGYIFSGYLLNLPVPDDKDVVAWFAKTLKLTAPAIEKKSAATDEFSDATFLFATYNYEGGIKVYHHEYYEGGGTDVTIPGMSAQEAFLLASNFYESFGKYFETFPEAPVAKALPGEIQVVVEVENGNVTKIEVGQGDGCFNEELITVDDNGATLTSDGGC